MSTFISHHINKPDPRSTYCGNELKRRFVSERPDWELTAPEYTITHLFYKETSSDSGSHSGINTAAIMLRQRTYIDSRRTIQRGE